MKIKRLHLHKPKRLFLSGEDFQFEFETKLQMIIGTNGSGKSSLMEELSPLPANPKQYEKNGFKKIDIEHNGSTYNLSNIFEQKPIFSFIKDGEELNLSYNVNSYKQLCKLEFGLDNNIHDVYTGVTTFVNMSVGERRKWFTTISGDNYYYALSYYTAQKEKLRDLEGALAQNKKKLTIESSAVLSPEEERKLAEEKDALQEVLETFLEMKTAFYKDRDLIETSINTLKIHFNNLLEMFFSTEKIITSGDFKSENELKESISEYEAEVKYNKVEINALNNKIHALLNRVKDLKAVGVLNIEDVDKKIKNILEEMEEHFSYIQYDISFENNLIALKLLESIAQDVSQITKELSENPDKKINKTTYIELREKLDGKEKLLSHLTEVKTRTETLLRESETLQKQEETECPECKHKWIINYDKRMHLNQIEQLKQVNVKIDQVKEEIDSLTKEVNTVTAYLEQIRIYFNFTKHHNLLDPIWNYIASNDLLFKSPLSISNLLFQIKNQLQVCVKIDLLKMQLSDLESFKKKINSEESFDIEMLNKEIETYEKKLIDLNVRQNILASYICVDKLKLDSFETLRQITDKITKLVADLEGHTGSLSESLRNEFYSDVIYHLKLDLSLKERALLTNKSKRDVINFIEEQIVEQEEQIQLLKMIVKAISPSEGLIAKYMSEFINDFTNKLNAFIASIWTYPFEIIGVPTTDVDDFELSYKFGMKINDDIEISDISLGSSAMCEIINAGFKIVNMGYLGHGDYPLYFDEFGSRFDAAHKAAAHSVITNLSACEDFSQIFSISHFENAYGNLLNTDIIVLLSSNIDLPENTAFNQHAKIT